MEGNRDSARKRSGATRRSATQEAILQAADTLAREARRDGGSAIFTTVKQIAARAQVSVSSVYNHFPGGVGSIALHLVERGQALGRPVDEELVALARMEQARVLEGKDAEAKIRAELSFLYSHPDADDRARELMRRADEDDLSPELRFLTRYSVADTIDDRLPDTRSEMLRLTEEAEALAASHGAPHVERQIMRDHRVNALMAPVDGVVVPASAEEAITLLRTGSQFLRRHEISMTAFGWRYDAACREFLADAITMRSVDDEHALRAFFGTQIDTLIDVLAQPREHRTGPDGGAVEDVMDALLLLEAVDLIDKQQAAESFSRLQQLHARREPDRYERYNGQIGYNAAITAAAILHGEKTSPDQLTLDELGNLTLGATAIKLAALHLRIAVPHNAQWPANVHRHHREIPHVRFELFMPEAGVFEIDEARRRIAALVDAHPKAPEGFTEIRPGLLHELEAVARQAFESGQPLTATAREHLKKIRDILG